MLETELFAQLGLGKPHYKSPRGTTGDGTFQSWLGIEITEGLVKAVDVVALPAMRAAIDRYLAAMPLYEKIGRQGRFQNMCEGWAWLPTFSEWLSDKAGRDIVTLREYVSNYSFGMAFSQMVLTAKVPEGLHRRMSESLADIDAWEEWLRKMTVRLDIAVTHDDKGQPASYVAAVKERANAG